MVSWDFDIVASLLEHQIVIRYLAPRSRRGTRTSPEGRSSCVPACTASRRGAAPAWWPQDLEKHRLSNIPLRSSSAAVMQRLLAHAGVTGVMDALETPAACSQTGPLVAGLFYFGVAAAGRAEAVTAVPREDRSGLGHHTCVNDGKITHILIKLYSMIWKNSQSL